VRAKGELATQRLEEERPLGVVGLEVLRDQDVGLDIDRGVGVSHDRCSSVGAHGTHCSSIEGWHGANACCRQGTGTVAGEELEPRKGTVAIGGERRRSRR
jgi:hypothetical protein